MDSYRRLFMALFIGLMFVGFSYAAFYQISFRGLSLDSTSVEAGDSIQVDTSIANTGEEPRTDIDVRVRLVRESDNSVVFSDTLREDVDLAGREIINIQEAVKVPEDVPDANYSFSVLAIDASGVSKASLSQEISVSNDREISTVSFGNNGVYLLVKRVVTGDDFTRTYEVPSYGTQGENVIPGSNFTIKFNLTNTGDTVVSPEAQFEIVPTYTDNAEPLREFNRDLGRISPQENNVYEFNSSVLQAGTYEVKTQILGSDGEGMGSSEVRLVIAGKGGSITDLANSKDTYDSGETVEASATVVGPADGSTVVNNAKLSMEVLKEGEVVNTDSTTIDTLPLSPENYKLQLQAEEDLTNYTLRVTLGKEGVVYDTYEADYQPLEAEKKLTEGGRIKRKNACFDDGVCTEKEFEIGTCYDCINVSESRFVEKEPGQGDEVKNQGGSNMPIFLIVSLLILVAGGVVYWRLNK
jgi:hypothetical protein